MKKFDRGRFDRLKKEVESARSVHAKAEGALSRIASELKTEFGVSSIEEVEALLADMLAEQTRLEARCERLADKVERRLKRADGKGDAEPR